MANKLSLLRVIVIVFLVFPLLLYAKFRITILALIVAWTTDILDGMIARRTQSVSALGAFLDYAADLLLVSLVGILAIYFKLYPHSFLPLILVILEAIVAFGFTLWFLPYAQIWQSNSGNWAGKISGLAQGISFFLILLRLKQLVSFAEIMLLIAILSKILSASIYLYRLLALPKKHLKT
jgi:phosphatidylglycerophosphate synthase